MLCAKFGLNWRNGSGEEGKAVKVYENEDNNDGDNDEQRIKCDQKSSLHGEKSGRAKKSARAPPAAPPPGEKSALT